MLILLDRKINLKQKYQFCFVFRGTSQPKAGVLDLFWVMDLFSSLVKPMDKFSE